MGIWQNGARDQQIQNVFQESIAGRQCKGRQPDFRHGRPLDIQLTLTGHWLGSWARWVERPNPSQPNAPPCTTAVFVLSARSSYSPARRGGLLPLVFLSFFPESLFIAENCFPTAKTVPSKAVPGGSRQCKVVWDNSDL